MGVLVVQVLVVQVLVVQVLVVQVLGHVLAHRAHVERPVQAQGPGERSALLGEADAPLVEVHAGASSRQASTGVGGQGGLPLDLHHDDSQQGRLRRLGPATHAGALRTLRASHLRL